MSETKVAAGGTRPVVLRLSRSIRTSMGAIGLIIFALIVFVAVFAPLIAPDNPLTHSATRLAGPSGSHLLGTDEYGRDILSRVLYGARPAVLVGVVAVLLAMVLAVPLGLIAGYRGGVVDSITMRIWDIVLSFPSILLGITLIAIVGAGTISTGIVIAVGSTPVLARVTRAVALQNREREYVAAAQMLGVRTPAILWRHLLPNAMGPLLVYTATTMATAVLAEAGLSFLGLGTQPPTPSWGQMLSEGKSYIFETPWLGLFPGAAIAIFVLGLTYLADGLGRGFDVRS